MAKQGRWYAWDSRGGERLEPTHIQLVNFDLAKNRAAWEREGAEIIGTIESGRMTYHYHGITCEVWREDQPNPTPYTIIDNPDPIKPSDGETRTWIKD